MVPTQKLEAGQTLCVAEFLICVFISCIFSSLMLLTFSGLRAQKVGQQCEAIVRFPGLFERFPFPILINSAFLKLADVFRDGYDFDYHLGGRSNLGHLEIISYHVP